MSNDNENFKILLALAVGAIGGLVIGNYLWGSLQKSEGIAKHVKTLGDVIEQLENIKTDESESLKDRINNILDTFENNYGNNKR